MKRAVFPGLVCVRFLGFQTSAIRRSATTAARKAAASSKQSSSPAKRSISGTLVSSADTILVIRIPTGREKTLMLVRQTAKLAQLREDQCIQIRYVAENGVDRCVNVVARSSPANTKKPSKIPGS